MELNAIKKQWSGPHLNRKLRQKQTLTQRHSVLFAKYIILHFSRLFMLLKIPYFVGTCHDLGLTQSELYPGHGQLANGFDLDLDLDLDLATVQAWFGFGLIKMKPLTGMPRRVMEPTVRVQVRTRLIIGLDPDLNLHF